MLILDSHVIMADSYSFALRTCSSFWMVDMRKVRFEYVQAIGCAEPLNSNLLNVPIRLGSTHIHVYYIPIYFYNI